MAPTEVVTVFLRNDAAVLLFERSAAVGSYSGLWGAVAGHAEGAPDELALQEIEEETGLSADQVSLVRQGEPFEVRDEDADRMWRVHPYLFEADTRSIATNWETESFEWAAPTELLRRETVPDLWTSYDRVRPTVETVASDTEHGSAYLSIRALEVLRDEAGLQTVGEGDDVALEDVALDLLAARPGMAAVQNRIHRVMSRAAGDGTPQAVHAAALDVLDAALEADDAAAGNAAAELDGKRVFTLSRSGTVLAAIRNGSPAAVVIPESRPGGEGRAVAEELSEAGLDVVLTSDANVPAAVRSADVILLGADTVFPNGDVFNKVGSMTALLAGDYFDVEALVVCARDKITPDETARDEHSVPEAAESLYDGHATIDEDNPLFERVPAALVSAVVTENGRIEPESISSIATELAALREWESA